jgi:hypothetical protein
LRIVNERMKKFYDRGVKEAPKFKKGDLVWLEAKNIHQKRPNKKFSDRRLGPFKVIEKVGDLNYRLELPDHYKIHPVFHVELLTAHQTSKLINRPEPSRPPPAVVAEGNSLYEVQSILDSRLYRGKVQYRVEWKGYPLDEATWEPEANLKKAPLEIAEFHKQHPNAVKSKSIASSILTTPEFLAWRQRNIRPSFIREDAHPRKGVMSRVPLTNHYSFLNRPKKPTNDALSDDLTPRAHTPNLPSI